jgi:hypothetical protein
MSHPDPELAAALEVLEHAFGPLQVLDVPTPPGRRPAIPPAPAAPEPDQPTLFDPTPEPAPTPTSPAITDPLSQLPPHRRWRAVGRYARPLSPAPTSTRRSL